jgi:hypothetical protein
MRRLSVLLINIDSGPGDAQKASLCAQKISTDLGARFDIYNSGNFLNRFAEAGSGDPAERFVNQFGIGTAASLRSGQGSSLSTVSAFQFWSARKWHDLAAAQCSYRSVYNRRGSLRGKPGELGSPVEGIDMRKQCT